MSKSVALSGHTHSWSSITGKPSTFAPSAHSHGWSEITDKPSTFTPSSHTHSAGDITSGTFAIARIPTGTTSGTVAQGNDSRINNGQTAYGWGNHVLAGYALNSSLSNYLPLAGGTLTGNLTAPTFIGALTGNASSATTATTATKLGTATVGSTQLPFYLNAGTATAITQANLRIGLFGATAIGSATQPMYIAANGVPTAITGSIANSTTGSAATLTTTRTIWGQNFNGSANVTGALSGVTNISMNNTLTGATTIEALTSITTPKVIFKTAGWSMEQSIEGVLELKYNGVIKQKFLNDGSIAATGELTAYVTGASGYSEFLPLSGGTLTGNLNINATLTATTMKVGSNDVLHKGNIGSAGITSIGLGNSWTIEQTATNLYIKKNGVIKGTFNA